MSVLDYSPEALRATATTLDQEAAAIRSLGARTTALPGRMTFECPAGTTFRNRIQDIGGSRVLSLVGQLEQLAAYLRAEADKLERLQEWERHLESQRAFQRTWSGEGPAPR